ncbi:flagellar export chaperone FlgN [Gracilimonas mengyeensis]|uniref:FlgN protein n=1 Tax=Gracilimonas mengyeensis TaxID=1302730 RepID=A0A521FHZ5_9BACT|nr:flagellar export chaperone FlgN [Gracilimonas mengyeensis]SMO95838.1 FlgN protein [Gracilimonas mengyeensis]
MEHTDNSIMPLQVLSETIVSLDKCSNKLIKVMEEQIDAIIASNPSRIEALSDIHSELTLEYKQQEKAFIRELSELLEAENLGKEQPRMRLMDLKNHYPEYASEIDGWHTLLTKNTQLLQNKHKQIIQLLEFAMEQNARLMHSMYSEHSTKNSRYSANGNRSPISTGVAVNQEV